uniref:VPS9 domain-containing protein n=1 Tax=Parascaris equorum TaxID=6256 RepID=A0A914RZU0_PAREQ
MIFTCVTRFAEAGEKHVWTTDDLLPAFMYVTVRAQLQHLGAEILVVCVRELVDCYYGSVHHRFHVYRLFPQGGGRTFHFKCCASVHELKDACIGPIKVQIIWGFRLTITNVDKSGNCFQ